MSDKLHYRKQMDRELTIEEMDENFLILSNSISKLKENIDILSSKLEKISIENINSQLDASSEDARASAGAAASTSLSNISASQSNISVKPWNSEAKYQKDSLVLFDGCLWHALDNNQGANPAQSTFWKQVGFKLIAINMDDDMEDSSMPLALSGDDLVYRDSRNGWRRVQSESLAA